MTARRLTPTKRAIFWQLLLLPTYALVSAIGVGIAIWDAIMLGPYTSWYNSRLLAKATDAALVGTSHERVQDTLGAPDKVMRFWEVRNADGRPASGARFVTTYEYYPYPFLPFAKFQVHCAGGIVRALERFDD